MAVHADTLVDAFRDSVGTGQAEALLERACSARGLQAGGRFTQEEALAVAEQVTTFDDVDDFVQISAKTLKTRIRTDSL